MQISCRFLKGIRGVGVVQGSGLWAGFPPPCLPPGLAGALVQGTDPTVVGEGPKDEQGSGACQS